MVPLAYFATVVGGRQRCGKTAARMFELKARGPGGPGLLLLSSASSCHPPQRGWRTRSRPHSVSARRRASMVRHASHPAPTQEWTERVVLSPCTRGSCWTVASLLAASLPTPLFRVEAVRRLDWVTRRCESLACCCAALSSSSAIRRCTHCASGVVGSGSISSEASRPYHKGLGN